jgi:HEAT repeat protein
MLFAAVTTPASGLLASGSVQPLRPVSGLDDPLSERLPFPYDRFAATLAALPAEGPDAAAIAGLKPHLDHQPRGYGDLIRERTIWTLAQARDGRLFEPLAGQVSAADWRVRAYAAWGLAMTGDRRATPLLSAMLDDPVWRVRAMAAGGIAGLGDPAAAEAVGAILDDPAWQVRVAAIDYVERVGDPALIRRLRPLLGDPHPGTRLRARDLFDRI